MFFSEQEEAYSGGQTAQQEPQLTAEETFDLLEESIEGSLTEAEKRLEKAQFYKAVMKGGFFGQNQSPLAKEVETEIRKFATERMNILLGISPAPQAIQAVKLPFTDQEIEYLKKMLQKAMSRQITGNAPPVVTPVMVQPVIEQVQAVQTTPNPVSNQQQQKRPVGRPKKPPPAAADGIPTPTKEQMERIMEQQALQAQLKPQIILTESKG